MVGHRCSGTGVWRECRRYTAHECKLRKKLRGSGRSERKKERERPGKTRTALCFGVFLGAVKTGGRGNGSGLQTVHRVVPHTDEPAVNVGMIHNRGDPGTERAGLEPLAVLPEMGLGHRKCHVVHRPLRRRVLAAALHLLQRRCADAGAGRRCVREEKEPARGSASPRVLWQCFGYGMNVSGGHSWIKSGEPW